MVSILIDSRSDRVEDFKDAMVLTVLGNAHEAEGEEKVAGSKAAVISKMSGQEIRVPKKSY
jgi:hypothetical protein